MVSFAASLIRIVLQIKGSASNNQISFASLRSSVASLLQRLFQWVLKSRDIDPNTLYYIQNLLTLIIVDFPLTSNDEDLFTVLLDEFAKMFKRRKVSGMLADVSVLIFDLLG